jgi:glycosyltransferase involved in cell wall biosynthesis
MVFPSGNIPVLARAMGEMAADPQTAARLGENARERVHTHYSIEQAMQGIRTAIAMLR